MKSNKSLFSTVLAYGVVITAVICAVTIAVASTIKYLLWLF